VCVGDGNRRSEEEVKEILTMGIMHALIRCCFGVLYVIKKTFSIYISQWSSKKKIIEN